ncbi:MAG: hypothetical protein J0L77_08475 [Alphaproteobacteria bacterium]|nr:hypothetical protein [Alphaproteobacteria bacterium]
MTEKNTFKTPAQKNYALKKEKLDDLRKAANKGSMEAVKAWKALNPDCVDLAVKPLNFAYIKRKDSTTKAIIAVANAMMRPSNEGKTQAGILKEVQNQFPETPLYDSLWQRQLSPGLLRRIEIIVNDPLPKPISLKGCKTLSQIRKKLDTSREITKGARSFKVKITFTGKTVLIGKKIYNLEKRSSGYFIRVLDKKGKRRLVNMDGLAAALLNA